MKKVVLGLLIVASLLPASLAAQAVTGTILGTITDATGAVMPGATVTLKNTGTGLTRTISAMLASPSCATCGTTERQIQVALKVKF